MPLTPEQIHKVAAWLDSKSSRSSCPVCGNQRWEVGDIVASVNFSKGGVVLGGRIVPTVQVICSNCYFVMNFAAVPLGLVE